MNSNLTRQTKVQNFVRSYTLKAIQDSPKAFKGITAGEIADALGLDRANISKELNSLYKSGQMMKFLGRPTLYLDRSIVSGSFPDTFFPSTIPKGKKLSDYIRDSDVRHDAASADPLENALRFDTQIGRSGTLSQAILSAKAAMIYPPRGVHTLLYGNVGTGKTRFAHAMYEFAVSKKALPQRALP